jgi:pantoate--beta-alanine ligase
MEVIYTSKELKRVLSEIKSKEISVGFVPTMGSLHAGHGFLLKQAKKAADYVVLSIFVNPTQFNEPSDFVAYPTALEEDLDLARSLGVDVVFAPQAADLYEGMPSAEAIDYGALTGLYEASKRRGHFDGVVAVVKKLFKVVAPDLAFFGEKDLQQLAVVRELVKREFHGLQVVACPLIRDAKGLALSSRNARLSAHNQATALELSSALKRLKAALMHKNTDGEKHLFEQRNYIKNIPGIDLEYFDVVNPKTFAPLPSKRYREGHAIIAANIASVRLIDNLFLGDEN